MSDPNKFTTAAAAARWDVDEQTARRYCRRGVVKAPFIGGEYRIPLSEIERIERDGTGLNTGRPRKKKATKTRCASGATTRR